MTMTNTEMKRENRGLEIEVFSRDRVRIRSTWPVSSPRGSTSIGTELLRQWLEAGVEAKRDAGRPSFFEAEAGKAWFYFHIANNLFRIYLVTVLLR